MSIKKISVFYNDRKDKAREFSAAVKDKIDSLNRKSGTGIQIIEGAVDDNTDIVISIGGDGTLLRTAREVRPYDIPIAHVNIGTLGFLGFETSDIDRYIEDLVSGDFDVENRIMIRAKAADVEYTALNDIVIKNGEKSRMVNLMVYAQDEEVYNIKGDGIIISTPTGSTAYSLAAGGPVTTPGLELIVITPLNPHSLSMRPVVVGDISVRVNCPKSDDEIVITADGQVSTELVPPVDVHIEICRRKLKLVKSKESFFHVLARKLKWG